MNNTNDIAHEMILELTDNLERLAVTTRRYKKQADDYKDRLKQVLEIAYDADDELTRRRTNDNEKNRQISKLKVDNAELRKRNKRFKEQTKKINDMTVKIAEYETLKEDFADIIAMKNERIRILEAKLNNK